MVHILFFPCVLLVLPDMITLTLLGAEYKLHNSPLCIFSIPCFMSGPNILPSTLLPVCVLPWLSIWHIRKCKCSFSRYMYHCTVGVLDHMFESLWEEDWNVVLFLLVPTKEALNFVTHSILMTSTSHITTGFQAWATPLISNVLVNIVFTTLSVRGW
jgi:hypothetical protein